MPKARMIIPIRGYLDIFKGFAGAMPRTSLPARRGRRRRSNAWRWAPKRELKGGRPRRKPPVLTY